jgi:hypothetical protein
MRESDRGREQRLGQAKEIGETDEITTDGFSIEGSDSARAR